MPILPSRFSVASAAEDVLQFVMGPTVNVFGTTAERDTYASQNPSWLAQYDAKDNALVKAGDLFYRRVQGAWESAAFAVGVAGDAELLNNVSSWNYPVKQPNGTFADGELTFNPSTKEVSTPTTFRTGVSAGIKLKDTHAISSVGENISFSNLVSDTAYTVGSWSTGEFGGEWKDYHRAGKTPHNQVIFQSVFDTVIVNPVFITPATGNRRTYGFYYKAAEAQVNCKVEAYQDGKEIFESRLFNIEVGDGFISFEVSQGGSGFVDLLDAIPYEIRVTSTSGDVKLLGNSSGVPYWGLKYQEWVDEPVASESYTDTPPYVDAVMTATGSFGASASLVNFDTIRTAREITLAAGEFTINVAGLYLGGVTLNMNISSKPAVAVWAECYRNGVWSLVDTSLTSIINKTDTTSVIQITSPIEFQAGDKLRIRGLKDGQGNVDLVTTTVTTPLGTLSQKPASINLRRVSA